MVALVFKVNQFILRREVVAPGAVAGFTWRQFMRGVVFAGGCSDEEYVAEVLLFVYDEYFIA